MRLCTCSQRTVASGRPDPPLESTGGRASAEAVGAWGAREPGTACGAPPLRRGPLQQTNLKLQALIRAIPSQGPLPASSGLEFPLSSRHPASSRVPPLPRNKSVPAVAAQTADARTRCLAFWMLTGALLGPAPPSPAPGARRALPTGTHRGRTFQKVLPLRRSASAWGRVCAGRKE